MEEWIVYMMNTYGYIGILILIAVENIFPPIPSEVILTFSGFLTTTSDVTMTGVIIFSTIGSMVGAVTLYGIGRLLDVKKLEIIVDRWGYLLRLTRKDIKKADEWFAKVGIWAVLIGRVVPIVRSLISIPAGMAKMNLGIFLLFTALGSLIWNSVLVYVGARVGSSWGKIVSYIDTYSNLVVLLLSFLILFFIVRLFWRRRNA
ncbi:DedA family protein [Rummeliibacillus stabekisii]|uniref:DedA family protein n=1 Tax=Rummeliibacillus stabekisii TaxID=241244 RepID=UPI0011680C4A|nr:DedA family protein [Rummeliibacillus stabekisii]MBB5171855.1 membrane protein DedA with SNARE-associated domain [Rummeliibacillus stabekisii]GEL06571.1 alkaline phosphatase [Rummeliibacillus stabekisii]